MKRRGVLHPELSRVLAALGHGDRLVIADAGLPVPPGVPRVDLAVAPGVPGFFAVLAAVLEEIQVEAAVAAEELPARSPDAHRRLQGLLAGVPLSYVPHEEFKRRTAGAVAVVRTGEFTPYCNVELVAGVAF